VGAVGGLTWHFKGFKHQRNFDQTMIADTETLNAFRALQKPCDYAFAKELSWCLVSKKSPPTIAIFGDSHADHLFAGVVDDTARGWLLIDQSSCPPASGLAVRYKDEPDSCAQKNEHILNALIASPTIKTVVLAERGMAYIARESLIPNAKKHGNPNHWHVESYAPREAGLTKAELYYNGMQRSITRLQKAGKKVVLFMDVPELDFPPIRCAPRPLSLLAPEAMAACAMPKARSIGYAAPYRALMQSLAKANPTVRIYDPSPLLCDAKNCYAGDQTMLFYHDTNHLSQRGSKKVMAGFMEWLNK
jgi:SGNH domain (fused to AT3 domains)